MEYNSDMISDEGRAWLAGIFETRGSISIAKHNQVQGVISIRMTREQKGSVTHILEEAGIKCGTPTLLGRTHQLNFSSYNGTKVLELILSYLRTPRLINRAKVYMSIFTQETSFKWDKEARTLGYVKWLKLMREEAIGTDHDKVLDKIKG